MRALRTGQHVFRISAILVVVAALGALPGSARAQSFSVSVIDNGYVPEPIIISPGTTITWKNIGKEAHTVTSDDGTGESFDSGTLPHGGSFSRTFNHEGAFTYHCVFHEDMLGTIIVQKPGGGGTPATVKPTPQPTHTHKGSSKHGHSNTVVAATVKRNYRFKPTTLKVKAGTKVAWENSSNAPHTVTSRTHGWKLNKTFDIHGKLTFVFKKAGTFSYYCRFHSDMVGTIVVHR
jgi:plastocyanin